MAIRKDVYELLCLFNWQERRQGFKPARFLPLPDKPPPFRPEGKLVFRSEVPDRLLPAYDIAFGEGLLEQYILKPEDQLSRYRSMGWPVGMPEVPQDKPWPVVPDWSDAMVLVTDRGCAAIALHSTKSGVLSERLKVDLAGEPPEAVWLGNRKVRVGDETFALEDQLADVLQALVEEGAATKPQLEKRSGRDEPGRLLKRLVKRFPVLEPYIIFPARRGKGGYSTTIVKAKP